MDKNPVWCYYNRTETKDVASCKQCNKRIKAAGGCTSGLRSHLKSQHKINILKRSNEEFSKEPAITMRPKITSYFKKNDESLEAVLSRMIAKDGIPFSKFCTSVDLRMLLKSRGYQEIPKTHKTIQKIVMQYAEKIKEEVSKEILKNTNNNKKFSLTTDEWTSNKNRRYLNVNVHESDDKFWNLGLSRIYGPAPAEVCAELIENKLKEFQISLKNIVCITSDGAAVMKKTVKLLNKNHQLCLVHGLQLAIIRVLYNISTSVVQDNDKYNATLLLSSDSDCDDSDIEHDNFEIYQEAIGSTELILQNAEIYSLITKIRHVVKLFRKSPTKNTFLQKYVKEIIGKELSLILDCRTRWSSLLNMLERFLLLKDAVRKSLIDLKLDSDFNEREIRLLTNIISSLQPVKLAVETLCNEKTNLYVADVTLKFMLDELTNQNTFLSVELKKELIHSIKERRTVYSDVLNYLTDPYLVLSDEENYNIFHVNNKATMIQKIVEILSIIVDNSQCHDFDLDSTNSELDNESIDTFTPNVAISMKQKLHELIKQKTEPQEASVPQTKNAKDFKQIVKKELEYFRQERVRGKYIQMVFDCLMTIRPASVESERVFSGSGLFCTKIRSNLEDKTLNNLVFLRSYFQKKNNQ